MKLLILSFLLLFVILFSACENENAQPDPVPVVNTCSDTTNAISYNGNIKAILITYCGISSNACHGNSSTSDISLTNYHDVKEAVNDEHLLESIMHKTGFKPMPQGGNKLSDCQIAVFQKWFDTGLKEN